MDDDELMDLLSRPMYDRKSTRPQAKSDISLEQSQAPIDLMSKVLYSNYYQSIYISFSMTFFLTDSS